MPDQDQLSAGAQTRSTDCLVSDSNINSERHHGRGDPEARVQKLGISIPRDFQRAKGNSVVTTAEADMVFCVPVTVGSLWMFGQCRVWRGRIPKPSDQGF